MLTKKNNLKILGKNEIRMVLFISGSFLDENFAVVMYLKSEIKKI